MLYIYFYIFVVVVVEYVSKKKKIEKLVSKQSIDR